AVVNQAAGGNRVLADGIGPSALSRLDRDVLALSGVRHLVVFEGVNDLGQTEATELAQRKTVEDLLAAYRQIALRAHALGIAVHGVTVTPFGGNGDYDDPAGVREKARQTLNAAIRPGLGAGLRAGPGAGPSADDEFDGVLDFDQVVRDPADPRCLLPVADEGDHLHLSPEGYRMLAEAVPREPFTRRG
ncbi:MAG: hypothetical protein QG608_881, partial [Actinomycetota bacterium]|nr:hypothetical protein [Actinomycetota bacterium]